VRGGKGGVLFSSFSFIFLGAPIILSGRPGRRARGGHNEPLADGGQDFCLKVRRHDLHRSHAMYEEIKKITEGSRENVWFRLERFIFFCFILVFDISF